MATPIGFLVYLANGGGTLIAFLTSLLLFLGELEGRGGKRKGQPGCWLVTLVQCLKGDSGASNEMPNTPSEKDKERELGEGMDCLIAK